MGFVKIDLLDSFAKRLRQMLEIVKINRLIFDFLHDEDLESNFFRVIKPLTSISLFNYTEVGVSEWIDAVAHFNQNIAPYERNAVEKIQRTLSSLQKQPKQFLREFEKLEALVTRPLISEKLGIKF
jgi:hypothetical protein